MKKGAACRARTPSGRSRGCRRSRCGRRSPRCRPRTRRVAVRARCEFFDGVPTPDTVSTVYDALDLMRGIEVFLNAVPGASLVAMRRGLRSRRGHVCARHRHHRAESQLEQPVPDAEHRDDVRHDVPGPRGLGPDGDRGAAAVVVRGRRLLVPLRRRHGDRRAGPGPGRQVPLPAARRTTATSPTGYFVYRCPTFTNWVVLRALGGVPAMKQTRIYPLVAGRRARSDNEFINLADSVFNTVHANDFSFYEEVDELVQEEPVEALDAERAGQLAAIGIVKGQPFAPDDRMRSDSRPGRRRSAPGWPGRSPTPRGTRRRRCTGRGRTRSSAAATSSCATAPGCSTRAPSSTTSRPSSLPRWRTPRSAPAPPTPTRSTTPTATCSTAPAPTGCTSTPNPPAKNFWAVDVYDTQTRSLLQVPSTIWPALASNSGTLQANDDGSYDLYFGPTAPAGKESNWVETIPGKSWFQLFRLYGPLAAVVRPDLEAQRVRAHRLTHLPP